MYTCALSDDLTHFTSHAANEARSAWSALVSWIVGKDATKIPVVDRGPIKVVFFAFAPVVLSQSNSQCGEWLNLGARSISGSGTGKFFHSLIDILKLAQRGPAFVATTPT
jgi:hypothetical protein